MTSPYEEMTELKVQRNMLQAAQILTNRRLNEVLAENEKLKAEMAQPRTTPVVRIHAITEQVDFDLVEKLAKELNDGEAS